MKTDKILDKNINFDNYATFQKCTIRDDGKSIRFTMACGISYDVSVDYLLKWFSNPHYINVGNKLIPWGKAPSKRDNRDNNDKNILQCRRIMKRAAVRVYLSDNTVYDVAWDTVLMACERRYEHFGGLTKESKTIVSEWMKKATDRSS